MAKLVCLVTLLLLRRAQATDCEQAPQVTTLQCNTDNFMLQSQPDECLQNLQFAEPATQPRILTAGFYIIDYPICKNGSIDRISLRGNDPGNLTLENSVELSVFKRYTHDGEDDLFVQQLSVNATPVYNAENGAFDILLSSLAVCVESGDYLGINILNEQLQIITAFTELSTEGIFQISETPSSSLCFGLTDLIVEVNTNGVQNIVPLLTVTYKSSGTMTSPPVESISTEPTSTESSSGSPSDGTDSSASSSATMPSVNSQSPNGSNPSGIVGPVIGGLVAIAILIAIVILTAFFLVFKTRKHKIDRAISSIVGNQSGDQFSMSTYDSQYQETHNFQPPIVLRNGVETVINLAAESTDNVSHGYHEPSEFNAAQARNRALPNLPSSTTVTNMHYASATALGTLGDQPIFDPPYQDPDELESTPMMQRNRKTFKNPLYSTTNEFFGGNLTQERFERAVPSPDMQGDSEATAIYDQPVELTNRRGSNAQVSERPTRGSQTQPPPSLVITQPSAQGNIYTDGSDKEDLGEQYTLPVSASAQSRDTSFDISSLPTPPATGTAQREYHLLEPSTEVVGNGQIYNLLDKHHDSSDEDEGREFLKSTAHHIVNEPGAYVPNSEERKELLGEGKDTLAVEAVEAWKKSSYKAKKFFVKTEEFWVPSKTEHVLFDQLSQKKFREIMRDQLKIETHLGQGQFGSVVKASWKHAGGGSKEVAIKIMKPSALEDAKVKFIQEAAILGQFFHSNVVKLYGLVTLSNPVMIVMEYMQLGDLLTYLHKNYKQAGALPPHPKTLLSFSRQIACGMKYLARKHFVHRDLAARNVFINETLVCKIGDFGMSRNLLDEDYYISNGGIVPVKWTAPEGLNYKKYSTASDVYSYGMTLYEIWSLGEKPLNDIPQLNVARVTSGGYCQPPPPGTPRKIYHIMVQCWNPEYSKRPSFDELFEFLNNADSDLLSWIDEDEARMSSPLSKVLGSPLKDGHCLYKDLQKIYNGINPDTIM